MIKNTFEVKTIGELLKEKRLAKGLNTRQVAEIIKIRPEYLEALEQGKYNRFPSEVYIKGFLKNYAKFLGIDKDKALALYRRENTEKRKANIQSMQKSEKKGMDLSITPERLILFIVGIVTIGILYYLGSQVSTILQKPELKLNAPAVVAIGEEGNFQTEEEKVTLKGTISPGATLTLNGDKVTTNNIETFEINDLSLNEGNNKFVLVAESQFGRESQLSISIDRVAKEAQNEEQNPPTQETPEAPEKMTISLEIALRDANVFIQTDGKTQMNQVLAIGTTRTFEANTTFSIQTPRPDSIRLKINGTSYTLTSADVYEWKLQNGEIKKTK